MSVPVDDSARARFVAGMRVMTPTLVGVLPFGLVTGVASTAAGLSPFETMALSVATFSGIVHIVSVQLYAAGAPIVVILLTAAVLSLRLVMYSAGLSPWLAHLPLRWKLAISYCLTDHAYALSVVDFTHHPDRPNKHWFIVGGGVVSFVAWQVAVAAGVLLGAQVPPRWSLDFSFALTFLALLVAVVHDRPTLVAALVGGGASLVTYLLPLRLGLVTAALAGIAAAVLWNTLEARWSGR